MNDDRQIAAESRRIFNFCSINSEFIVPIFTKISHDIETLVQLLIPD